MAEFQSLIDLITKGGLPLVTAAIVVGGWRGWYVWGWTMTQMTRDKDAQIAAMRSDRDEMRALAQRATTDAEKMIEWALAATREKRP